MVVIHYLGYRGFAARARRLDLHQGIVGVAGADHKLCGRFCRGKVLVTKLPKYFGYDLRLTIDDCQNSEV